jgi:hypothetical protein
VPIKTIIESAAACIALDPPFFDEDPDRPCATATLDPGDALTLQDGGPTIGVASVETGTATINMQTCTDLRERPDGEGRVDLRTFGDCVVIDALEFLAEVDGTATVCNAFQAGLDAGLSASQVKRAIVHRFSTDADLEGV